MDTKHNSKVSVANQVMFGNMMRDFTIIQVSKPNDGIVEFYRFSREVGFDDKKEHSNLEIKYLEVVRRVLAVHLEERANNEHAYSGDIKTIFLPDLEWFALVNVRNSQIDLSLHQKIISNGERMYRCAFSFSMPYTKDMDSCSWLESSLFSIAQKIKKR